MENTDQGTSTNANSKLMEMATTIVSSFVAHNSVRADDLPALIRSIRTALAEGEAPQTQEGSKAPLERPVSIKKSITPDYLISMEDGKRYRTLKRHLTKRGLSPAEYREKWGLPRDYPMVAPSYSQKRSEMAKSLGLGQARKGATKASGSKSSGKGKRSSKKAA